MYSSYTAASFARKHDLADQHGVNLEGALTWAFEFEDQPYFAGFRSLASNGIDKPVLNVFRMFSKMTGRRLTTHSDRAIALQTILKEGVRENPDVGALASLDKERLYVLVWHYHDDEVPGPDAAVQLTLDGVGFEKAAVEHFRIDQEHSNSFTAWKKMGAPQQPTAEQYAQLERNGQLASLEPPGSVDVANGRASLRFTLPRQGVSLLVFRWSD
jgi:xylan 1,4-beta-xylosidase